MCHHNEKKALIHYLYTSICIALSCISDNEIPIVLFFIAFVSVLLSALISIQISRHSTKCWSVLMRFRCSILHGTYPSHFQENIYIVWLWVRYVPILAFSSDHDHFFRSQILAKVLEGNLWISEDQILRETVEGSQVCFFFLPGKLKSQDCQ